MRPYCVVPGCWKTLDNGNVTLHSIPRNKNLRIQWLKNIGNTNLTFKSDSAIRAYGVCNDHFDDSQFQTQTKMKLNRMAVPTLNLPVSNDSYNVEDNNSTPDYYPTTSGIQTSTVPFSKLNVTKGKDSYSATSDLLSDLLDDPDDVPSDDSDTEMLPPSAAEQKISFTDKQPRKRKFASTWRDASSIPSKSTLQHSIDLPGTRIKAQPLHIYCSQNAYKRYNASGGTSHIRDCSQQSNELISDPPATEKYVEIVKGVSSTDASFKSYELFIELCDTYLPVGLAEFVKYQAELYKESKNSERETKNLEIALESYFLSPPSYDFCYDLFNLPSKYQLKSMIKEQLYQVSLSEQVRALLHIKWSKFVDEDKQCVLCIDDIALQPNLFYNAKTDEILGFHQADGEILFELAQKAVVFTLKGIEKNWKQVLGYLLIAPEFNHDSFSSSILTTLLQLRECSFNVRAVITNIDPSYQGIAEMLNISSECPYFMADETKIYYLYNIPSLMKATRNSFLDYKFCFSGFETNKMYLEQFFDYDIRSKTRLAPKLTDAHMNPNAIQKQITSYALDIFDQAVKVGMDTCFNSAVLPPTAFMTINFIEKIAQIYQKLGGPLEITESYLKDSLSFFNKLALKNDSDALVDETLIGQWKTTLAGLLELIKVDEISSQNLFKQALNYESINNLVGLNSCKNNKTTTIDLIRSFKQSFIIDYMKSEHYKLKPKPNLDDYVEIVAMTNETNLNDLLKSRNKTKISLNESLTDYRSVKFALNDVGKYLLYKCLEVCACQKCVLFSHYEEIPLNLVKCIRDLDNVFIDNFAHCAITKSVVFNTKLGITEIDFMHPCTRFPMDFLVNLFLRMRMYHSIKDINSDFNKTTSNWTISLKPL